MSPDVPELEQIAQELVVRVRDDEMESNQRWLTATLPDPVDWFRLCFVLAAGVPDDRSWRALTMWTLVGLNRPATAQVRELQPHGTFAAYRRHLAHSEEPCDECDDAGREYERTRKRARRGSVA